jgi:hypothetical protein
MSYFNALCPHELELLFDLGVSDDFNSATDNVRTISEISYAKYQ